MLKEFKEFAAKGNMLDMAVGIVIGAAFGAIVKSLVSDVIMPPIGLLLGNADFANMFAVIKQGTTLGPYATVAAAHDAVLKYPAPDVFFTGFGDSSLDFDLLVWIADPPRQRRIASELCFAIFDAFNEHDIEIPFPQRDLHLRSAEVLPVSTTENESKPD